MLFLFHFSLWETYLIELHEELLSPLCLLTGIRMNIEFSSVRKTYFSTTLLLVLYIYPWLFSWIPLKIIILLLCILHTCPPLSLCTSWCFSSSGRNRCLLTSTAPSSSSPPPSWWDPGKYSSSDFSTGPGPDTHKQSESVSVPNETKQGGLA